MNDIKNIFENGIALFQSGSFFWENRTFLPNASQGYSFFALLNHVTCSFNCTTAQGYREIPLMLQSSCSFNHFFSSNYVKGGSEIISLNITQGMTFFTITIRKVTLINWTFVNFNRELRDFCKANTVILNTQILNNIYFNNNWEK